MSQYRGECVLLLTFTTTRAPRHIAIRIDLSLWLVFWRDIFLGIDVDDILFRDGHVHIDAGGAAVLLVGFRYT